MIDAIVEAVDEAGGTPKRITDAFLAARAADDEQRARARTTFLTSQRALTLINRELDSLSATVLGCAKLRERFPWASPRTCGARPTGTRCKSDRWA